MLLQAALDFKVDLAGSYMIGDRFSDVLAGQRAGTRTVLVETGMHDAAPIESMPASGPATEPDARCPDLGAAVDRILAGDLA
jgi:D-glycero-D-manno-heptose 1,7-bisphosphate phosphatase